MLQDHGITQSEPSLSNYNVNKIIIALVPTGKMKSICQVSLLCIWMVVSKKDYKHLKLICSKNKGEFQIGQ